MPPPMTVAGRPTQADAVFVLGRDVTSVAGRPAPRVARPTGPRQAVASPVAGRRGRRVTPRRQGLDAGQGVVLAPCLIGVA